MCENPNSPPATTVVTNTHIVELLKFFSKNTYWAGRTQNTVVTTALEKTRDLIKLDFNVIEFNNSHGEFSVHYPAKLLILESELTHNSFNNTIYENTYDPIKLKDLICEARKARCRTRFPIPVIIYKGKAICRSATLSGGPELYGRHGLEYLFPGNAPADNQPQPEMEVLVDYDDEEDEEEEEEDDTPPTFAVMRGSDWVLFDTVRSADIRLLKMYNVATIVDFMVENKKMKYGLYVSSSEKVDKVNRYHEFNIMSLPYPGCEFFKNFRDNDSDAEGLMFDWTPSYHDAIIRVPSNDPIIKQLKIDWNKYKEWDLITITQNYLKLILKYIQEGSSGILLHCISGWDRTPLYISLVRMLLWADGLIHQELNVNQILYLTIAYDWMLFGHHLPDRIAKGEEVFLFCFYMLKHLTDDEYSICGRSERGSDLNSDSSQDSQKRPHSRASMYSNGLDQPDLATEKNSNSLDSSYEVVDHFTEEHKMDDAVVIEQDPLSSFVTFAPDTSPPPATQDLSPIPEEADFGNNGNGPEDDDMGSFDERLSIDNAELVDLCGSQPVMVPETVPSSDSSVTSGSWQLISNSARASSLRNLCTASASNSDSSRSEPSSSQDSIGILTDPDEINVSRRSERLMDLRGLFYYSYYSGVGFTFKSAGGFKNIVGNIGEKLGFLPKAP